MDFLFCGTSLLDICDQACYTGLIIVANHLQQKALDFHQQPTC